MLYKRLCAIAIPVALQHLILSFNSVLDNLMVSRISVEAAAAVGSANKFLMIARATLFGLNSGCAVLTAQYFAKKDKKGMTQSFYFSMLMSLIFYSIFLVAYLCYKQTVLKSFSSDVLVQALCASYLDIAIFSGIFLATLYPLMASLRSKGIVYFPFIVTIGLIGTNLVLNYTLIFGKFGFDAMGIRGAAIATLISEIIAVIVAYAGSLLLGYTVVYSTKYLTLPSKFVKKYLSIASPLVVSNFLYTMCMLIIHNIFGLVGVEALSAMGIIQPLTSLAHHLFTGMGSAAAIIVGQELGHRNFDKAYGMAKTISTISAAAAAFVGVLLYFSSDFIASFYNLSPSLVSKVSEMLGLFGLFFWSRIYNSVTIRGILRSGGDSSFILFAVASSSWLFALPACYIAYLLGLGPGRIYALLNFSEIILSLIILLRVRSKKWLKSLTEET